MFDSTGSAVEFQQSIFGTWGRFRTPAGTVEFIETKARVGTSAKDREKRLTTFLRPVREVLPTQAMDFNQLLQRDLDDHRVATELVPYILSRSGFGPAFFPPIVAALLPFDGTEPRKSFSEVVQISSEKDTIATWSGYRFGTAFKFERMQSGSSGQDAEIKLGRLSWNPEEVKLVVIDGQHRAMALLAIDRTINSSWSDSGDKYKYFYEPVIQEILKGKSLNERRQLFEELEFPVTLVWFPSRAGEAQSHHVAARKLFVDVNKNARQPTQSRILLLSDAELIGIFTRRVLNEFRQEDSETLPIFAIEYDNPERDQASAAKWSVISNVMIVRDCLRRIIFGPDQYISNLRSNFGGRESKSAQASFMRSTLQIDEEIGETVDDIARGDISNTLFPRSKINFFQEQMMRGWGEFVVRALSEILPYKVHGEALTQLRSSWATAGSTDTLAKDAVFEGVGMYWTIRDSYRHWEALNQERRETKQKELDKTDIVRTWEAIEQKKGEFRKLRARLYLGREDATFESAVNGAFEVFGTNACQLGLSLAARSLAMAAQVDLAEMPAFISALVSAANAGLLGGAKSRHGRRTAFWKNHEDALNRISRLDTPFATHFRYFWLELLCTLEARPHLTPVVPEQILTAKRDEARSHYFDLLAREMERAIRRADKRLTNEEVRNRAAEQSTEILRKALSRWFGIKAAEVNDWKATHKREKMTAQPAISADDVDESNLAIIGTGDEGSTEEYVELLDETVDDD